MRHFILARSLLFNTLFYVNLVVRMIVALPALVLPHAFLLGILRRYAASSLWLLRVVCGTGVAWRGREKLPAGAYLVACKHQSAWETFALFALLPDPTFVLKRELMWIPLFGWFARKARMIPIDRGSRATALGRMAALARAEIPRGRQIVIFPEGTRRPPGAAPHYLPGVAYLYAETGLPCVPVALNSGLFWPRRSLRRYPGTVLVEVLDPIPPALDRRAFLSRLQTVLEDATARLVQEESEVRNQ
ncbi:MAG: lysophospholipid acyltransferase family protein [Xanthobacteraceae bacterium]|nr:lysophospholipid acyltransferase family protein [Xanthobacteraceae bacterium]